MTLMSLNLLDAGAPLELDDLNAALASHLPMVSNLAPYPMLLPPNANSFFDVFFDVFVDPGNQAILSNAPEPDHVALLDPYHPYVLEVVLAADDDPGNVIHLYSQALSPPETVYLPIIRKN